MKIEKVEKLVATLRDKTQYAIHIRVIKFNQNDWLKPYIYINTDLRKKQKYDFEKDFFKLMNSVVFGKTMENVWNNRDVKLVSKERKRNYLVSEPNYHTTKFITENLLAIELKTKQRYLWINLSS